RQVQRGWCRFVPFWACWIRRIPGTTIGAILAAALLFVLWGASRLPSQLAILLFAPSQPSAWRLASPSGPPARHPAPVAGPPWSRKMLSRSKLANIFLTSTAELFVGAIDIANLPMVVAILPLSR